MKKYLIIPLFFLIISCSQKKGVYWCGDHPCINNKEKEAYFKKTMIVEIKDYNKNKIEKDSEIKKILDQAKIDEEERIFSEKELKKKNKIEEKELAKQIELEEKRRIKEEKELAKQIELEEKRRIKEEKELAKQIELEEKRRIKEEKELAKQIKLEGKKSNEIVKIEEKKSSKKELSENVLEVENNEISEKKFDDLVKKIIKRNNSRSYPEINDIPK